MDGVNGTFVPLANPAVSGERIYIITAFKPFQPTPNDFLRFRLYAIDVRTIMVERIKVIWYQDATMTDGTLPFLKSAQADCIGESNPLDFEVAHLLVEEDVVVAAVNFLSRAHSACSGLDCQTEPVTNSLLMSVTDKGDSCEVNFITKSLRSFQAVAYVSPNFTVSRCNQDAKMAPPVPQPSMWVSWFADNGSVIEKVSIKTGEMISKIDDDTFKGMTLTSKLAIFYNDQLMQCNNNGTEDTVLTPLVVGYSSGGKNYLAAIDVSPSKPEMLWSVKAPLGGAAVVGQITTAGQGRDTMMALTSTEGAYLYIIYAEE